jgi:hypothetical protein
LQHLILMSKKYMKLYKRNWLKYSETQFARQTWVTFGSIYVWATDFAHEKKQDSWDINNKRDTYLLSVTKLVVARELKPSLSISDSTENISLTE